MIPGLGLIRRAITLILCGAAFWAGLRLGQGQQEGACRDASGAWDDRGFCVGALP
jgi:hypothetical protein